MTATDRPAPAPAPDQSRARALETTQHVLMRVLLTPDLGLKEAFADALLAARAEGRELDTLAAGKQEQRQGSSTGEQLKDPPRTATGDAGSTPAPGTTSPARDPAMEERAAKFNIESRGRAHGGVVLAHETERLLELQADFAASECAARDAEIERLRTELEEAHEDRQRLTTQCAGMLRHLDLARDAFVELQREQKP